MTAQWAPSHEMLEAAYGTFNTVEAIIIAAYPFIRAQVLDEAATATLEQRCERETPWDLACTTIAAAIRALIEKEPQG